MKLSLRPLHVGLRWPWPALLAWALAWALFATLRGLHEPAAAWTGTCVGVALAWAWPMSAWRKALVAGGFPLALVLAGQAGAVPAALWLLPLALLLLLYPLQAWRDAPLFPTPPSALLGLAEATALPGRARVLDAGCGLGHGLGALRRAMPEARIEGIERSWPLRWLAGWRCPWARVRHGDMWRHDWSGYDLVYLFQRPESMAPAWAKARAEMRPGSWLASLEFKVPGQPPRASLQSACGRTVWLYRMEPCRGAQLGAGPADNTRRKPASTGRR